MIVEQKLAVENLLAKIRVMQKIGHRCPYYRSSEECPICDVIRATFGMHKLFPVVKPATLNCILPGCDISGTHNHGPAQSLNAPLPLLDDAPAMDQLPRYNILTGGTDHKRDNNGI